MKNTELFLDLGATAAAALFLETTYPWEVLPRIGAFVRALGPTLPAEEYDEVEEGVWLHRSVKRYPGVHIAAPAVIGPDTELRPGAFLRGSILVGRGCVVGNSTELKNCILFDKVQVPHYNYVGDSILGRGAHLGAGAICSNVRTDKQNVVVHGADGADYPTGLRKFGAILGDGADVGCNSVLCPGAVLGPGAQVYPLSRVRGTVPAGHIFKAQGNVVPRR